MSIKIYTLAQYVTPEYRRRIFPLLFDLVFAEDKTALDHFELVDQPESADLFILPVDINYFYKHDRKAMDSFLRLGKQFQKPIWLYSGGDFGISVASDEGVFTFRLSGFHTKLDHNTFILPSFVNDPYEKILYSDFYTETKLDKPNVGFVGHADGTFFKWLKELSIFLKQSFNKITGRDKTDFQAFYPSSIKRFRYLEKLAAHPQITANFIYRSKYRAGSNTENTKEKTTLEFFKNIEANLYTFCLRGSGNFSVRFYETLMMGRIPLLIDTDARLPLQDEIDWKKHCVIASPDDVAAELLKFHNGKSDAELKEIQIRNRKLAQTKLNRVNYFITMANKIVK